MASSPPPFEGFERSDDLLTEILLCLPTKSLSRFKCVSARWLSLISTPSFRRRHTLRHAPAAAAAATKPAPKMSVSDATAYINEVKNAFQDEGKTYGKFLDLMKGFKAQRIDTNDVVARVKEIFEGNRELILGFNRFLPNGYKIIIPPLEVLSKPNEFEEAIMFVNKVKARFEGNSEVYKSFLDTLNMYKTENKSIAEISSEVAVLFQGHTDLIDEFTSFIPNN